MRDFVAGGGGVSSESGWVRLGCLRVGGSGRGHWRFADGGGDISVARRAFLGRMLRFDGARGERGVGTRWKGVVGTVARHTSQCLQALTQTNYLVSYLVSYGVCQGSKGLEMLVLLAP